MSGMRNGSNGGINNIAMHQQDGKRHSAFLHRHQHYQQRHTLK
jgi:hypothetical protein